MLIYIEICIQCSVHLDFAPMVSLLTIKKCIP